MLKAGIIGCGRIGIGGGSRAGADLYYTHAGAYLQHPKIDLVAAADIEPSRLEMVRAVWGTRKTFLTCQDMLHAERPDVVSICVPDDLHYDVLNEAIKARVPAIWCEKPFTLDVEQAREAVRRCAEQGIVLAVNHQRRWEPEHQRLRNAIAHGELGAIQHVRGLYYGSLIRVGTHLVDLLRFLLGEVAEVAVLNVRDLAPPSIDVRVNFQCGATAILQGCQKKDYEIFEVDIIGTLGRVQITDFGHRIAYWRVADSPEYPGTRELQPDRVTKTRMREAFLHAVDDIIGCLERGCEPQSSGREATGTIWVLEHILSAARLCP